MTTRKNFRAAVYMLIKQGDKYLVIRRHNTGYRDGQYTVPAGHVDDGESARAAAVRELAEEVDLRAIETDAELVHAMQRHEGEFDYIDFYFNIAAWQGKPCICEPDKMDDLRFMTLKELETVGIPGVISALHAISIGERFSSLGV